MLAVAVADAEPVREALVIQMLALLVLLGSGGGSMARWHDGTE